MKKPRFINVSPFQRLRALSGRRGLTFFAALLLLSVAASALVVVRSRAAAAVTSTNDLTAQRSTFTANSLSWLTDTDWKNPRVYANGSDVFSKIFGSRTAPANGAAATPLSAAAPMPFAPLLFWRTDATSGTWTGTNWSNPASATGGTGWTGGDDAEFSGATSSVTYVTGTSVGNVTVDNGQTATVTAAGTLPTGTHVITVGTGSTLTWTSQVVTAGASSFDKEGAGIWNTGSGGTGNITGGFTLGAGTIIGTGTRSFGAGALAINGGTIQTSGGSTFGATSVTVGGDFSFAGTGNDIWNQTWGLGASTRTITNSTTSTATRTISGIISGGAASTGLTFAGTGGSGGIVLSGANTYTGNTTINGGIVNAGIAEVANTSGPFGKQLANAAGTIILGGGTLQFSAANTNDYSGRFSTAASQAYNINTNGQSVTFATALTSSGGTLTKSGTGTLTLSAVNTYSGTTTISAGTLALSGTGSLASTKVSIASGATFDVTGHTGTVTFTDAQTLDGTNTSATPGKINGNLTMGTASPITLAYASGNPTLNVTNGTLTLLSGEAVTVNTSSALGAGNYTLISANGTSGFVTGTAPANLIMAGSGLAAGMAGSLQITGSQLVLHVQSGIGDVAVDVFNTTIKKLNGADGTVAWSTAVTNDASLALDQLDFGVYTAYGSQSSGLPGNVYKYNAIGGLVWTNTVSVSGGCNFNRVTGVAVDTTSSVPGVVWTQTGCGGGIAKSDRTTGAQQWSVFTNDVTRPSIDPANGQIYDTTLASCCSYNTIYSVTKGGAISTSAASCEGSTELNPADGMLYRGGNMGTNGCGLNLSQLNKSALATPNWTIAVPGITSFDALAVQPWSGGHIYVGSASNSKVVVVDPATQSVITSFTTAVPAGILAVNPNGGTVYVASSTSHFVYAYSPTGALVWTSPDLGAPVYNLAAPRDFVGTAPIDSTPPVITYTPLGDTTSTANRGLSATVTDTESVVPTSGAGLPVIYFRKGTIGPYSSTQSTSAGGGAYNFSIDYSLVSGGSVSGGDTIQYFVAAQDGATAPNATTNPSTGASGFGANPPSASTPPTTPSSYAITPGDVTFSSGTNNLAAGTYHDVTISNCSTFVHLTGNVTITGTLTINTCAVLYTDNFTVSGGGAFVLASGGWLHITDANGITTSGATGNIRTIGGRSYSNTANYDYDGSGPQATGDGLPASVNDLLISNTGGAGNNTVTNDVVGQHANLLQIINGVYSGHSDYVDVDILALGTLSLTGNITVSGNWSNAGTFTPNGFTVNFDGSGTQTITTGGATAGKTFNGLTVSNSSGSVTVAGNLAMGSTNALGLTYASGTPTVSQTGGAFALAAGNPVTVTTTSALGAGNYVLVSAGSGGSVTGTAPANLTMAGSGVASGMAASLQITGSQLVLHVQSGIGDVAVNVNLASIKKLNAADGTVAWSTAVTNDGSLALDQLDFGVYTGIGSHTQGPPGTVYKYNAIGALVWTNTISVSGSCNFNRMTAAAVDTTSSSPGVVWTQTGCFGGIAKSDRTTGLQQWSVLTNDIIRPSIDPANGQIYAITTGGHGYNTIYSATTAGSLSPAVSCEGSTDLNPADGMLYRAGGTCGLNLSQLNKSALATPNWTMAIPGITSLDSFAVQPWSGGHIYIASVSSNKIVVVDPATQTVVGAFSTAIPPGAIAVNPNGGTLYVGNGSSNFVYAYSPSGTLVWTSPDLGGPVSNLAAPKNLVGTAPNQCDYCLLLTPTSTSVASGGTTPNIFGQIFETGVTEAAGANAAVTAQVGFGPLGSDPRSTAGWTFFSSAFNAQVGSNDEYQGTMTAPAVVTTTQFSYTYRFSLDGGLNWNYADSDGAGTNAGLTFSTGLLGTMTVTGSDTTAPAISYTAFGNTNSTTNRVLTATITDAASGVASGPVAPRIYFRKNANPYGSNTCSGSSPTYSCTIDYSLISGVSVGDTISYFVVAQDVAGNLSANPSAGFAGTDVNTVPTPPTTPNSYTIVNLKYRSVQSGDWNANSTWESSLDGSTWVAATATPTSADDTIEIQSSHTVTVTAPVTVDQVTVDAGSTLATSAALTNSGAMSVSGTFQRNEGGSVTGTALTYLVNSTVNYSGTSAQTSTSIEFPAASGPPAVTINNPGGVTLHAARTVNNFVALTNGVFAIGSNLTLADLASITRSVGSFSGTPTFGANVFVTYTGPSDINSGTEIPAAPGVLRDLVTSSIPPFTITLTSDVTVNNLLLINGGSFDTGANTITVNGSRSYGAGRIIGNEKRVFTGVESFTFDVGTANGYSPVTVNVTAGTSFPAEFTVTAVEGAQPNVPLPIRALSRYWTLTGTGVTADLTFKYLDPTDIPGTATEGNFVIQKYDGSFTQPGGSVNTGANTATISGVTSFSDWTLAEPAAVNPPTLTVNKVTDPPSDTGVFNLQIDGSTAGTGTDRGNGGTTGAVIVSDGVVHTVGETAGTSTTLSDYTSVISGPCALDGTITLAAGENKTCTITNTRKPRLTVTKVVAGDSVGRFNLQINGSTYATNVGDTGSTGAQFGTIGANTFDETGGTIPSTSLSDYTTVITGSIGCTDTLNGTGSITLAAGDNKTCTITNTKNPRLTVTKVVVGDTVGRFNLQINGTTYATNVGNTGSTGAQFGNIGANNFDETGGTSPATSLGDYTTVITGSIGCTDTLNGTGSITLAAGDNKTCTITNTKTGTAETEVSVSAGNLLITDGNGGTTNDTLTLSFVTIAFTDYVRVHDPNNTLNAGTGATQIDANTVDVPLSTLTSITVDTLGGNDTLTLDLSGGDFIPSGGLSFAGGDPTTGPGDKLFITGGNQDTVTYSYTNAHDGNIVMSNFGTVSYTGLEPISNSGNATDIVFNLPAGPNTDTVLADDGTASNTMSRLSGSTFEQTDFANPTGSLTINRGDPTDTLTVNALPDFDASLTIGSAGSEFSAITFNDVVTLAAGKNLSANASSTITLTGTANLTTSGAGTISLTGADVTGSGGISTGGGLTVTNTGTASTLSGIISGASLTKQGAGTLVLSNANTYTGNTISGGVLSVGVIADSGTSNLGLSGTVQFLNGATLQYTGSGANTTTRSFNASSASGQIDIQNTTGSLNLSGAFSGLFTNTLTKLGPGTLTFSGSSDNGSLILDAEAGTVLLAKSSGVAHAVAGISSIAAGATVALGGTGGDQIFNGGFQIPFGLVNLSGGTLDLMGLNETIDRLTGATGTVTNSVSSTTSLITIGAADGSGSFGGVIQNGSGTVALTKVGSGTFTLSGANTYTGTTTINGGTLSLSGAFTNNIGSSSTIDVQTGAFLNVTGLTSGTIVLASGQTLKGNGTVTGKTTAASGSFVSPGASPGILNTGDVSFNSGSTYAVEINGTTPGSGYDQLNVTGAVSLGSSTLSITGSHTPLVGQTFTIVNNDGADAITGEFNNLPEGAVIPNFLGSSFGARISYLGVGGTGNDVVLTVVAADYTVTTSGNAIVVTDVSGNGDTLAVSEPASGQIKFAATGRSFLVDGATFINGNSGNLSLSGVASITVDAAAGADTINVGAFTSSLPSLTLNGGVGDDTVNFNGNITFAADANLDVDLQNDDASPGTDSVSIASSAQLVLSGTGTATVKVSKNVLLASGSKLQVANGALTVEANQQVSPTTGNFVGVDIDNGLVASTGTGNITVTGKGGNNSAGSQVGVRVRNGGDVLGGTGGTVTVTGTGGASTGDGNNGTSVIGTGSSITSSGSSVQVVGTGGGSGSSGGDVGVLLDSSALISSGGTGPVSVQGNGATGVSGLFNHGVLMSGSTITSGGGIVNVTGTGGSGSGSTGDFTGIHMDSSTISAGGGGGVTVVGNAGTASPSQTLLGVDIRFASQITSSGGSVSVTGTGGNTTTTAVSSGAGIRLIGDGTITAGGTGTVTVAGTGVGGSTTGHEGIVINGSGLSSNLARIGAANGATVLTATSGNTLSHALVVGTLNAGRITTGANNPISITADSINFGGGAIVSSGTNSTTLVQKSASRLINLGGADSGTQLGLTDSELDVVTAGTLNIGDSNSGAITVSAAIDLTDSPTIPILNLVTGANVLDTNASGNDLTVSALNITAATGIAVTGNPLEIQAGTLTTNSSGSNGDQFLAEADTVTIGANDLNAGSGTITLAGGRFNTTSGGDILSNVVVGSGATLGGTGSVSSTTTVQSGGFVSPGASPGILNTGDVSFSSGSTYVVEIDGTTPGSGHDQLNVTGAVSLGGSTLSITGSHTPAAGDSFTIVRNDDTDTITGTFSGLPEGAIIPNFLGSPFGAKISYVGGADSNDVVLTVVAADVSVTVSASSVLENGGTNLDFTFTRSGNTTGTLTVSFSVAGTADFGTDYAQSGAATFGATAGTVTFASNIATAVVTVDPTGDATYEANETVILAVTTGSGYNIGSLASATGTIANDDGPATNATLVVNTTDDVDNGACLVAHCSLREAINAANFAPDANTINFNIPISDPGFDGSVFTIKPLNGEYTLSSGLTTIDGASQIAFTTDTNPAGPEIVIDGSSNTCGSFTCSGFSISSPGNSLLSLVINKFTAHGISMFGAGTGNTIKGCYVGTNPAGTASAGNAAFGITGPGGNTIGGLSAGEGNVISGNGFPAGFGGIGLGGSTDIVRGNKIGTNAAGTAPLANKGSGIVANGGGSHVIEGNLISGNTVYGIEFSNGSTDSNTVKGNKIGTDAGGTVAIANGSHGVRICCGAGNNTIGGANPGDGNVIAFNGGAGVVVHGLPSAATGAVGNRIFGNSIFENTGLGIDLANDGITPNDPGDTDTDPDANNLQNFPVIRTALTGTPNTIRGTLNSTTGGATFTIDLYSSPNCNDDVPNDYGEGKTYLGSTTSTATNGAGDALWSFNPASLTPGTSVTATATDSAGNTSEFSKCFLTTAFTAGTIGFTQGNIDSTELNGGTHPVSFTVTRTGGSDGAVSVNYTITGGGATIGEDYTVSPTSGTFTWANGNTADKTITITVNGDPKFETDELVNLTLSNVTGGASLGTNPATLTIKNDDPEPKISIDDVTHSEGSASTIDYDFTVSLSNPSYQQVTVNAVTADNSATTSGLDYTGVTSTLLTFAPNTTTQHFHVLVNGDLLVEPDEQFFVNLSGETNATILKSQGIGAIINDDTDVSVAVSTASVAEDGATNLVYTFTRNPLTSGPITVNFAVGGTADFGTDYTQSGAATFTSTAGTVVIPNGATTATVTLDPTADPTAESDETVSLTVSSGTGYNVGAPSLASATITNDDTNVAVAVSPSSALENDLLNPTANEVMVYTFTRTGITSGAITANFSVGGTATFTTNLATTDYTQTGAATFAPSSGTVTFGDGVTTATVTIDPVTDAIYESNESVILTVTAGTGYTPGTPAAATGTITNDDPKPSLTIGDRIAFEGTTGGPTTNFVFTVTRTPSEVTATVDFATADGTTNPATGGVACGGNVDYVSQTGSLTFLGNQSSKTITIAVCRDATVEANETFFVELSNETEATIADGEGRGTIQNDDSPGTVLTVNTTDDINDSVCDAHCTLREAITALNGSGSADAVGISFAIPASDPRHFYYANDGVVGQVTLANITATPAADDTTIVGIDPDWPHSWWSILPTSSPPPITHRVVVDGLTQTGATANDGLAAGDDAVLRIELNGASAGGSASGLTLSTGTSNVQGLVINRFSSHGVDLQGGTSNSVVGNFIGTDVSGTRGGGLDLVGNTGNGITTTGSSLTIGGSTAADVNLISGNTGSGISFSNSNSVLVLGNLIGTKANGAGSLGNAATGISFAGAGSGFNTVGGDQPGDGNTIAFNGDDGVHLPATVGFGTSIRGNSIFSNGTTALHLGIDLGADGVTANDGDNPGTVGIIDPDSDTGPNNLQNFPIITSALVTGSTRTITGTLNSTVGDTFTIDFYQSPSCDHSGNGEGKTYLGSTSVVTDGTTGDVSFTFHPAVLTIGQVLTATATSTGASFSTSEFSACAPINDGSSGAGDIQFTSATYTVAEDVSGASVPITLIRVGGTNGSISAQFTTANGTATAGADFTNASQTVTFLEGETSKTINVSITDDSVYEGNETVSLSLGTTSINAAQSDAPAADPHTAVLTITENDLAPTFTINDVTHNEGNSSTTAYTFTVTKAGSTALNATVDYATVNGTAAAPTDFTAIGTTTLVFLPADTTKQFTVLVNGDTTVEPDETFTVHLSNPINATIFDDTGDAVITNDDTDVSVAVSPAAVSEDGAANLVYTFTRSGITSGALTVNFSVGGTATFATDYTQSGALTFGATSGTVTFGAGDLTKTVTIDPTPDSLFEPNETVILTVTSGTGYNAASPSAATGTINNDDAGGGIIRFNSATYNTTESSGVVTITVERVGDTSAAATVDYATPDDSDATTVTPCATISGAASPRCDFTTAIGTLRWAAGDGAVKTFNVLISQDNYVEGPEALTLTLSNLTGGAVFGVPSTATLTIADDATEPAANPIDDASNFVRQQYHDFLNREPDSAGLAFWTNEITSCGSNQQCIDFKRVQVSAAFYISIEFQDTGYLVERLYKASYGDVDGLSTFGSSHTLKVPVVRFSEFLPDTQEIGLGVVVGAPGWPQALENNKAAFALEFVQRSRFVTTFPTVMTPTDFVTRLFINASVLPTFAERQAAINEFGSATNTADVAARSRALRRVAENATLVQQEFNRAFVLMQYFGYLRRNPNSAPDSNYTGFDFWLTKLNQFNGNFQNADMVKSFLVSGEYRNRAGQ